MFLQCLKEPLLNGLQPGSPDFFVAQKSILRTRPLLRRCYDDWYRRLLQDARSVPGHGLLVELGSGGSYLKDFEPALLTSDVTSGVAEMVIDARRLPFADGSVKALLLTHVFHHIPDVTAFLAEAQRVLVPGGVISMIEVAHTPFARFFFKNFHHEPFEDDRQEWSFAQKDSMMDSNQALAWMVFVRDRKEFERRFPGLQIEQTNWMPWFTYLASGGVTARYLVPRFMEPVCVGVEWLLKPLTPLCSLHWHICLRKSL